MKYKIDDVKTYDIDRLRNEFLAGSESAYASIYKLYVNDLYAFGLSMRAKPEMIEDAIHDIFVEIYTHRHYLDGVNNIKSYFITSFRNRLIYLMKKELGMGELNENDSYGLEEKDTESEWIEKETTNEKEQLVQQLYSELNANQREVLYHRFVEGLTLDEIAVVMKINYQSVKNLIHRSIKKLKKVSAYSLLILLFIYFAI